MKKRTKEENAAYARAQRLKAKLAKSVAPPVPVPVSPVAPPQKRITRSVSPAAPCQNCAAKDKAIEHLKMIIESMEKAQGERTASESPRTIAKDDDAEALRKRVIAAKVDRFNSYGKNPVIGRAAL